jgi:hypothetical protein
LQLTLSTAHYHLAFVVFFVHLLFFIGWNFFVFVVIVFFSNLFNFIDALMDLVLDAFEVILADQAQESILVWSLRAFLRWLLTGLVKGQVILYPTGCSSFASSCIRVFVVSLMPFRDNLDTLIKSVKIFCPIFVRIRLILLVKGLVRNNIVIPAVRLYHVCVSVMVYDYRLWQRLFLVVVSASHINVLFRFLFLNGKLLIYFIVLLLCLQHRGFVIFSLYWLIVSWGEFTAISGLHWS